jgi:hypothetical protein
MTTPVSGDTIENEFYGESFEGKAKSQNAARPSRVNSRRAWLEGSADG